MIGSEPTSEAPSDSSTIAAGGCLPPGRVLLANVRSEVRIASPIAVPPVTCNCAMAERTSE